MARIFVTAFEPYDHWSENASWLTLVEFTKHLDVRGQITTRLYPVNLTTLQRRLESDLAAHYDYAIHLGQFPGSAQLRLEAVGINVSAHRQASPDDCLPLVPDGPTAYRSRLPLAQWAQMLRRAGIPATVSYHAGIYLCNAILYLSHYLAERAGLQTQSAFLHVPLDTSQAAQVKTETPALPASVSAAALRMIVDELVRQERPGDQATA